MEIIRILGVDPSLRNTGLAIVSYNTETGEKKATNCQVLVNPSKFTGTDAILNMLDMIKEASKLEVYESVDTVIVESPPIMFNKSWAAGTISLLAHISGGAIALLGLEKGYLFKPGDWNKRRKKEITHQETMDVLGHSDNWHYEKRVKSEKFMEHILDAASMALWWIHQNYEVEHELEEEDE